MCETAGRQTLLQPKDHLNYRYHHKRAFYLAVVAAAVASEPLFGEARWEALHDDMRKPVLVLPLAERARPGEDHTESDPQTAAGPHRTHYTVRVHVMCNVLEAFARDRLLPHRNGVRADAGPGQKRTCTPLRV
jgi:hypothetical protein